MSAGSGATKAIEPGPAHANTVQLVGRLSGESVSRGLPSGDIIVSFRVVVERDLSARRPGGPTIDTIDCVAWAAGIRRAVGRWGAGDVVAIDGALRRRFWRGRSQEPSSRYEVEVRAARRLARAA